MSDWFTRFCVLRHGETAWNAARRIQGQLDPPLNARGRVQARSAARALAGHDFAALYSSDLLRARETAEVLGEALRLPALTREALRERHHGVFQGHHWADVPQRFPEIHARFAARQPDEALGNGESLRVLSARVLGCLDELARSHPGSEVLAVTHGGVLDILYREATGRALDAPRDFAIPNASVNWFQREPSGWRLLHWNACPDSGALDEL